MSKIISPNSVRQLENLTGTKIPDKNKSGLQRIMKDMPVRLTGQLAGLCRHSPALARQFLPDIGELSGQGIKQTWVGILDTGIPGLERMYLDRCIILPYNQCPAYCRFCFRKFHAHRSRPPLSHEEINRALDYIQKDPRIQSVLVTGGDPLMDLPRLEYVLRGLRKIEHLQDIRIGTRSILYQPEKFNNSLIKLLLRFHHPETDRPLEIATHFNHPDELTPPAKKAILKLNKANIRLYNQTVLLKGINDQAEILQSLFRKLHLLGVENYYLFHCEPVRGIGHLRTTIQKGINIKKTLREKSSGRINPHYMICTRIGKVEIGVDGYIEKKEGRSVWIKTPYNISTFRSVQAGFRLPAGICKTDNRGYISTKYL